MPLAPPFHITVGSSRRSVTENMSERAQELNAIKLALLYGEEVEIINSITILFAPVLLIQGLNLNQRIELIYQLSKHPNFQLPEAEYKRKDLERLVSEVRLLVTSDYPQVVPALEGTMSVLIDGLEQRGYQIGNMFGLSQYAEALNTGFAKLPNHTNLVEYSAYFYGGLFPVSIDTSFDTYGDKALQRKMEAYRNALDSNSHLMLDPATLRHLNLPAEDFDTPSKIQATRMKRVALAQELLARLPDLTHASFQEIVDIRKELALPLSRFRMALAGFADEMESAPWDKDFIMEAEDVIRYRIGPSVSEIEDEAKSNSYIMELWRKVRGSDFNVSSGSALGVALSSAYYLPDMVSKLVGVGAGAAILASDAHREWKEKQASIQKNRMFFYYEASRRLDSNEQ